MTAGSSPVQDIKAERVDRSKLASVASISVPLATLSLPLVVFLPEFYANALGLDLALVGTLFTAVRLLDIAVDPVLGSLMDRTTSRWGRYRPWLAAGTPLFVLSVAMLFFARPGVGPLHLLVWLVGVYAAWSILALAQLALGAELSPSYTERSRVYGWIQAGTCLGVLLALGVPLLLQRGEADATATMRIMGWLCIIGMPLSAVTAFRLLGSSTAAGHGGKGTWTDYFRLMRTANVMRLLWLDLMLGLASGMTSAVSLFFQTRAMMLARADVSLVLIAHMIAALLAAPLWARAGQRLGKHHATLIAVLLYIASQLALLAVPPGSLPIMLLVTLVGGSAYAAFVMFPRAMMADIADEELLQRGVDRTGLLYSLLMGTWKVGQAASVGLAFTLLAALQFRPQEVTTSPAAVTALYLIYVGGSVLLSGLSLIALHRYPLTARRHAEIRTALRERADAIRSSKEGPAHG